MLKRSGYNFCVNHMHKCHSFARFCLANVFKTLFPNVSHPQVQLFFPLGACTQYSLRKSLYLHVNTRCARRRVGSKYLEVLR